MRDVVSNIDKEEFLDYEKRGDCYTWCFPINLGEFDVREIWKESKSGNEEGTGISLYIHIPYCRFICSMCPFTHEIVNIEELNRYVKNLIKEIHLYAGHKISRGEMVSSIYFGGGTASILNSQQVNDILKALNAEYNLEKDCEVCLECHPNTVTKEYLEEIKKAGVTRVSFGIQSFQKKNLYSLKLWQEAERNKKVIQMAMEVGFHTVAMDLMYNFPDETIEDLVMDLEFAVKMGVQGLSVYALDPEVRKLNSVKERQRKMKMEKDMFYLIREKLEQYGYLQIAQPDYALPGHENRQIIDLWGAPQKYNLGFGAGAFSENFNGCTWANIHDPKLYMEYMERDKVPVLMGKKWSVDDEIARYMALGVRMLEVPLVPFQKQFGMEIRDIYKYELEKLQELKYITFSGESIVITEKGRFYIDNISKTFFNLSNRGRTQYWGCKLRECIPVKNYLWDEVMDLKG